jgi:thiol-disulfide isomerase/thioredoxin
MRLSRSLAALAAASLTTSLVATSALAAPPPATPAKPATGDTLEQVEKAMTVKRYEAVLAYAKSHPKAADAEEAGKRVVEIAEEAELWDKVVTHADEFAAAFATSANRAETEEAKAKALLQLGRTADAKKAYKAATAALVKAKHGPAKMWELWSTYAELLAESDDVEAAKAAYADAKAAIGHPQVDQMADDAIEALALIGTEPTAFPDGTKDLDGKALSLADYKGKVVLIDFWATWCGPCRGEIPNVVAAYKKWHDKGFEVLGISLDKEGDETKLRDFMKEHEMPWRQYFDGKHWQNEIAQLYKVHGIPHTILVGRDGKIVKTGVRGETVEKSLAKLLK